MRVWGQPTAYMDEVICAWHSELIQEEAEQAQLSQDCFSGELTETVLSQKRLRQQGQHVIGPHVTGRLQLTDTTFAAGGKQAGETAKGQTPQAPEAESLASGDSLQALLRFS